ncbi:MAG: MerR family transcriptional regulator, partial [Tumebacillaceae bacterium]
MDQPFYTVSQFAQQASVSVRTLRYYDKSGLLTPSHYSESGYRLYTDADLVNLQYILALKFLGFSLEEIKVCLETGPQQLQELLAQQKAMMIEKRVQLDAIIHGIELTEKLVQTGQTDSESMINVIRVIQMEHKQDLTQYLTPEQRKKMREIVEASYTEEAREKLLQREWSEEDRRRQQERYATFRSELTRVVSAGADPASAEGQEVARLLLELNHERSQGDPGIIQGMRKTWETFNALPDSEKPQQYVIPDHEREFIKQACTIY